MGVLLVSHINVVYINKIYSLRNVQKMLYGQPFLRKVIDSTRSSEKPGYGSTGIKIKFVR
jgi:hypothetical protein